MNRRAAAGMMLRMGAMAVLAGGLCGAFPAPVVRTLAPFIQVVTQWTSPYVEQVRVSCRDRLIRVECRVRLDMTRVDGSPLPRLGAVSEKGVWQTLHLVVIALAVFAAPAMPLRRRLAALPVALIAIALVCAYQQSVEIQSHVLRTIGSDWFPSVQPASTAANIAYYNSMQSWYAVIRRLVHVNAGGGAWLLAVLAGLAGYGLPVPEHRNRTTPPPPADSPPGP